MDSSQLPLKYNIHTVQRLSLLVIFLTAVTSLAGLLLQTEIYPTKELRQAFVTNDIVNLLVGLPIFYLSLWLINRGKLMGLLGLPGALVFITYNAVAYAASMPFTWLFFIYLTLAILSAYTVFRLIARIDGKAVKSQLQGRVAERFGAGVLVSLGALFCLRAISQLAGGTSGQAEFGVLIADLLTTPFWILGGILLWKKQPLGYVSGAGLLFQASMLFVGLLIFFVLQPFVAGVPFPLLDFIIILLMGMICFVPFWLFVRGGMQPIRQ